MKKTFCLLILTLLFSACSDRKINDLLDLSEEVLNRKPDSTLILLQKIKKPDRLTGLQKARYNLYHSIANIRKGTNPQTDSPLTEAIELFIAGNDSAHVSNSCLWAGKMNMLANNYTRADSFFVRGISFTTNSELRTLLYESSGLALLSNNKPEQSLQQHLQSLKDTAFLSTLYKSSILANIGQAYRYTGETDSAITYYQKAIRKSLDAGTTDQTAFYYNKICEIEKEKGNFPKATAALKTSMHFGCNRVSFPYYMLTQAHVFIASGEVDSAKVYLKKAIQNTNSNVATRAYQLLATLYEQANHQEQIYYAWKNYEQSISNISGENLLKIMGQRYQEEVLKNENSELKIKQKQQDIYLLTLSLVLITACTIWYIIYSRLRKKKIISEQLLKEQRLKGQVAQLEKERELISLREKATTLREQVFRRLSASQKIPSLAGKTKKSAEDQKSRLTSDEIEELIQTVNEIWSGFAERLKTTYPRLRTKDIVFCCLLKSGISTKDLASIYYITPSAISQKKTRMKREKFGIDDDNQSLDDILNVF